MVMIENQTTLQARDIRILEHLQTLARDVAPVKTARIAAAVAIKGTILSLGNNQLKSHPFHRNYGKNEESLFWHAETHAIHNFIRRHNADDLQKATLYVTRMKRLSEHSRDFGLGIAKPCRGCMSCIQDFGIPRIVYSNSEGSFSCEVAG
jgi:tRNA(Arg) A34 adenosine deaminase TadA